MVSWQIFGLLCQKYTYVDFDDGRLQDFHAVMLLTLVSCHIFNFYAKTQADFVVGELSVFFFYPFSVYLLEL